MIYILGVITARAGSKTILGKNIKPLCGIPLIEYTIAEAEYSTLTDTVISTDDHTIIHQYQGRCYCIDRPKELSQDNTPHLPVIQHAVATYERYIDRHIDAVMTLQPTSPLRKHYDIDEAIQKYIASKADSLYSGYYYKIKTKDKVFLKATATAHFQRNGAIFITSRDLLAQGRLWSGNAYEYHMPESRSIEIDTYEDWFITESLIKNGVLI